MNGGTLQLGTCTRSSYDLLGMRWLLLLGIVTACGDNIPAIPFQDFAVRRRAADCEREVRCGLFSSADACAAYTYPITDESLVAAVADGRVHYNELAALNCVAALPKVSCDTGTHEARIEPAACIQALAGTLHDGDACAFDTECMSRQCMQTNCDPATCCPGTCVAVQPTAVGGACATDPDCVAGAYCGPDHQCHALGAAGETCYADSQCADGLGCITTTNPGTCRPLAASGETCQFGRCAQLGEHCGGAMTCVAVGLAGAPCSADSDCSPRGWCDPATTACAELPDVGMQCTARCAGDAWCNLTTHTCAARLTNAKPCNTDNQCATGYCAEGPVLDACADRPVCD